VSIEGTVAAAYGRLTTEPPCVSIRTRTGIRCVTMVPTRLLGGLLLLALVAGGCGGDDPRPPAAAETDAAHQRWRERVDDACFEVNRAIGRRGRPVDVSAIGRTVADGVADVRAGIRKVVRVPLPEGGSRAPAAFVRALKGLDAELAALPDAGAGMEPAALVESADRLAPRLRALEARAGQAGLAHCMTHTERELVPAAVRAPIFLAQLERHDRRFVQRLPVYAEPASTPAELARRMEATGAVLAGAVADASRFDPPHDAAEATGLYVAAVRRLLTVVRRFEAFVRRGGTAAEPAGFRSHQRAFRRAWREASRAQGRMRSRAGLPERRPQEDGGQVS
jgi:hypothetical protein